MAEVMDALEGADVAVENWKPKKNGEGRIRRLEAYDLALLLAIAHRQYDEWDVAKYGPDPKANDYLCFGGENLMAQLTRMGTTKLEDCRDFLVATNLISYEKSAECPQYLYPTVKKKKLDYVWRLNKPALRSLTRRKLEAYEPPPREGGEPATQADQARDAGTKTTCTRTPKSSMSPAADEKADRRNRALVWIDYIALKYDLTPEQKNSIGVKGIIVGTAQKRAEDLKKAIDAFGQTDMLDRKFGVWVGTLVGELKDLPNAEDLRDCLSVEDLRAYLSLEKLERQFGAPMVVDERTRRIDAAKKLWNELYNGLELKRLPDDGDELSGALKKCLIANAKNFDATIAGITDTLYTRCGCFTFAALREAIPDAHARAEKLKGVLTDLTP